MKTMLSSSSALGRNYHTVLTDGNPLLIITGERTYRCGNIKSYWWKFQSRRQALLTLSWCQRSTLAAGHCLSDNIDMPSQHNENLLMPCAAVMIKLTECTELLFVLFMLFNMCQCPRKKGRFNLTGVNHFKAHYTQFEDRSGTQVWTMKNVAVVTNLRIYHWTIKQSCSAGNGTHWTLVPWCVQSHVKTQLTFWQHPPFCFHLPFSAPVPAYPVCGLCCDLALYLRSLDYHIHIRFIERHSAVAFLGGERANTATWTTWARSDLKVQILVKWEVSLWCCGHVARQHVFGMTFPLFVSRGCPAPGLGWVCARGQPHQTLSYYLSIFPHCAQRWQLVFSCL